VKGIQVFESARLLALEIIPEIGFSAAHKPVYIPTLIAEKSHEIVQISSFRNVC
jgi:hypothetical protein